MEYYCNLCETKYAEKTHDGICEERDCWGEELVEYTGQSVKKYVDNRVKEPVVEVPPESIKIMQGLCLLVCDMSGSMDQPAFPPDDERKLRMVTSAVHEAIAELAAHPKFGSISNPDQAFIGIIAFGAKAALAPDQHGQPFILSVTEIQQQFSDRLGDYLYECFQSDKPSVGRERTDITAALELARGIYDAAIAGDLSGFGTSKVQRIMEDSNIVTMDRKMISVPNVRVMLYSDGEHNPPQAGAPLKNAFESLDHSVLMTAFIGDEKASQNTRRGADQMLELANTCPEHGKKGYFLINKSDRVAMLRKLFQMTSGASGFCLQCLKERIGVPQG